MRKINREIQIQKQIQIAYKLLYIQGIYKVCREYIIYTTLFEQVSTPKNNSKTPKSSLIEPLFYANTDEKYTNSYIS